MKPFYSDTLARVYQSDVFEWCVWYQREIEAGRAEPMHAIVTDPPYGLGDPPPIEELLKAWLGNEDYNTGSGFMNARWDCVVHPKVWRALLNVTHPGGYLFAFSGTRTADLLGIACRLGGWEPFDRIQNFSWVQAQGMKKGIDVGKQLDQRGGVLPEFAAFRDAVKTAMKRRGVTRSQLQKALGNYMLSHYLTDGTQPAIPNWQDYQIIRDTVKLGDAWDKYFAPEAEREVIGQKAWTNSAHHFVPGEDHSERRQLDETAPATPLAETFAGYHTGLSPKHEPVLLFRRPREGRTFAQCAREFGSGGLNIGETRVNAHNEYLGRPVGQPVSCYEWSKRPNPMKGQITSEPAGRWPPNTHFTHAPPTSICPACSGSGCDECHGRGVLGGCRRVGSKKVASNERKRKGVAGSAKFNNVYRVYVNEQDQTTDNLTKSETVDDFVCIDGCAIAELDEMAGERKSSPFVMKRKNDPEQNIQFMTSQKYNPSGGYAELSTNASRFFVNHDWSYEIAERLASETPFKYVPKVSNSERSFGLAQHLPRTRNSRKRRHQDLDGSWLARAKCKHPTLKPLSLLVWLARLCKPPDMFSPRICIPFAGAMSEAMAARLAGWQEIHAIELERVHCEWGVARWKAMDKWSRLTGKSEPGEIIKLAQVAESKTAPRGDERQTSLFGALGLE